MRPNGLNRTAARLCLTAAAMTAIAVLPPALGVARAADGTRPNILVIITDDQRLDGLSVMPKTASWFADGGTNYPNAVVTTPLCCPSRTSILTGTYAHNHGVLANDDPKDVLALDQTTTIESYLHGAGYHTGFAGKFLNTWPKGRVPPFFDRSKLGDAYMLGGQYQTDVIGDFAVESLDTWENTDSTPWFMYLAPKAPHEPYTPKPIYANAPVPPWTPPPSNFEADRSDKPPWVRSANFTQAQADATRIAQSRSLMSVDDMVDRIMRELDSLGETNTMAVFLSDNGYFWGEHGIVGIKRLPYLESVEVPFYVRWPGHITPGGIDTRLVAGLDLAPTFMDIAGLSPPANHPMDGISLLSPFVRARMHLEYYRSTDAPKWPAWAATLTHDSEYIESYDTDLQTVTFREYYNLANDPWQLVNLLGDGNPGNDPNVAPLAAALAADRVCRGSNCLISAAPDSGPPTQPTNLAAADLGAQGVRLTWTASTDDVGVTGYSIARNGTPLTGVGGSSTEFVDATAPASGTLTYDVAALDAAGHTSPAATVQIQRTGGPATLFSDGFESGSMSAWTASSRLTVQGTIVRTGSFAARAVATGSPAFAKKVLANTVASARLASQVQVVAHNAASPVILLRIVGANAVGLARLLILPNGQLAYRNDVANVQRTSSTTLTSGWHSLELAVVSGTSGSVQVVLDGVIVAGLNRAENLGSSPVGSVEIGDHVSGRTYNIVWDDVRVTAPA